MLKILSDAYKSHVMIPGAPWCWATQGGSPWVESVHIQDKNGGALKTQAKPNQLIV
jgi:hypothetical protein